MHLAEDLGLDDEQRREIDVIIRRSRDGVREVMDATWVEMRAVLSPEQQEVLDTLHPPGGP